MSKFAQTLEALIKSASAGWGNGDGAVASDSMTIANLPEGAATAGGMGLKGVQEDKRDPTLEWVQLLTKKQQ